MSKRHQLGIAKCLAIARSQIISVMYKRERERERERESLRGRRVLQGPRSRIDYGVALQNAWSLQGLIGVLRPSG